MGPFILCRGGITGRPGVTTVAPAGTGYGQAQHLAIVTAGVRGVFHDQGRPAFWAASTEGKQLLEGGPGPAEKMVGQLSVR